MAHKSPLTIILSICFGFAAANWSDAINSQGLARIPIQNPDGYAYFMAITMGTPAQDERFCVLGTNHALNAVFDLDCKTCPDQDQNPYNHKTSSTYFQNTSNVTQIRDDGLVMQGHMAMDKICLGMYGTSKQQTNNPKTQVCKSKQVFFKVSEVNDFDWSEQVTNRKFLNAVCGLGNEKATDKAQGLIASAAFHGLIDRNAYSITLAPQKLAGDISHDPGLPSERSKEEIMRTSFLTIGGWDEQDYTGDIYWFGTGDKWDQVLSGFKIGNTDIVGSYDLPPVIFEMGYPYIGFSPDYFDKISNTISRSVPNMKCSSGEHWGMCSVANMQCDRLGLDEILTFTINKHDFTIPLENLAVDVVQDGTDYCIMQIGLLSKVQKDVVVLGSAFFTAFVGIFDTENERIGFAESSRALAGNSIVCNADDCPGVVPLEPDQQVAKPFMNTRSIILVCGLILIVLAICIAVVCWKKREASDDDGDFEERMVSQAKKSKKKKGYSIRDEKEDDSDEDDNLSIDYEKPGLN